MNQPVRMLAVSHNFNLEGASLSMYELLSGLKSHYAVETTVMSWSDGALAEQYREVCIQVETTPFPLEWLRDEERIMDGIDQLADWLKQSDVEVVYANTILGYPAILAAHKAAIPTVWNIRESQGLAFWRQYLGARIELMLKALPLATTLVFVAEATCKLWQSNVPGVGGVVVPNGFNPEAFSRRQNNISREAWRELHDISPEALLFLCVGTLHERKGQLDLVRAAIALPEKYLDIVVVCLGDSGGQYSDEVHELLKETPRGLRKRIRVLPRTPNPGDAYQSADVFVCCSRNESYPRVILEAMAMGLPIITTPVFGIREQVVFGRNALEYSPGDSQQLKEQMVLLCENTELRSRMGAASRKRVDELPGYGVMLEAYCNLISGAVDSWQEN